MLRYCCHANCRRFKHPSDFESEEPRATCRKHKKEPPVLHPAPILTRTRRRTWAAWSTLSRRDDATAPERYAHEDIQNDWGFLEGHDLGMHPEKDPFTLDVVLEMTWA